MLGVNFQESGPLEGKKSSVSRPAVLKTRLAEEKVSNSSSSSCEVSVTPLQPSSVFPLTPRQERMYFMQLAHPNSRAFHVAFTLHLTSRHGRPIASTLHPLLTSALETIVSRHSSLRVSLHHTCSNDDTTGLQLLKMLHETSELKICNIIDSSLEANQGLTEMELVLKEIRKPIDIAKQVFHFSVIQTSEQSAVVVLTVHHIVTDGVSMLLVVKELLTLLSGETVAPNPLQFTDLLQTSTVSVPSSHTICRQPSLTTCIDPKKQKKLDKWINMFSSATKCTSLTPLLPYSGSEHAANPLASEDCFLELPDDTNTAMQYLSHTFNASPVVILTTMFTLALHNFTKSNDIIIGMVNANRSTKTSSLFSYMVNTLPLRVDYTAPYSSNLGELVKQVRRNWSMALDGDIDLGDLVLRLPCLQHKADDTSFSSSPLQVFLSFSFYSVSGYTALPEELSLEGTEVDYQMKIPKPGEAHVNLTLEFNPERMNENGRREFMWEYQTHVLDKQRVRHLHSLICGSLVEAARLQECHGLSQTMNDEVVNPLTMVESVSGSLSSKMMMMEENVRYSIVNPTQDGSDTSSDNNMVFIQLFEKTASEYSTLPAFRFRDGTHLTYSQVQNMVSRIALMLIEKGVNPADHIGVYLTRSPWLYMCLLAVLKCGAAYVPIALQNSPQRSVKQVKLTETKLVITETSLLENLTGISCPTLCIVPETIEQMRECLPLTPSEQQTLAKLDSYYSPKLPFYLITTSGTTGQPKAIVLTNSNLLATIRNIQSLLTPRETRITLASSNVSFDAHILDGLAPLLNGACLVVVDNITHLESGDSYMSDVTYLFATPSAASLVTFPDSIQTIIVGGESMSRACLENTKHIPRVLNVYGPSECTVITTCKEVQRSCDMDEMVATEVANIGRPFPNVQLLVLDESQQPVPVNQPGILYIGGPIVSDVGYYKDPERMGKSFVQCPLNLHVSSHSNKVYNTGDWVCMLPDGNFKFIGRKDDQVKLRGMRFQLLEVEKTLSTCPGIKSAVALVNNPSTPSAQLVGYVTPGDVDKRSVLDHVSSLLPTYMVPSLLVTIDELPLTKEGKVDRRALRNTSLSQQPIAMELSPKQEASDICESVTTKLANIFGKLLQVTNFPLDGNFFAHGGHSLLCFQLMKQVNQELGARLNLTHILQQPTPQGLADYLQPRKQGSTVSLKETVPEMFTSQTAPTTRDAVKEEEERVTSRMFSSDLLTELGSLFDSATVTSSQLEKISSLLAQETGYEIPAESLRHYSSIEMLEAHLEHKNMISFKSTPQSVTTILYPPSSPTDTPTFYFHSGTVFWGLAYTRLAQALKTYSIGIQCTQEAALQPSFEDMCAFYLKHIRLIQPHGPYQLVGFCFGSIIVYEVARQLVELGEKVDLAVLINNSPTIEKGSLIFDELGQPPPSSAAHPYNYFEDKLKIDFSTDEELQAMKREGVSVREMATAIKSRHQWLPFTTSELIEEYLTSFKMTQRGMFLYKPQPIKTKSTLVNNVVLIRNREIHPLFKSHDYGLQNVVDADCLSVIIYHGDLQLDQEDSLHYMSSVIKLYMR